MEQSQIVYLFKLLEKACPQSINPKGRGEKADNYMDYCYEVGL